MKEMNAELKARHTKAVDAFVRMSLMFIPILAVPAFGALYIGEKVLENRSYTYGLLGCAFILSWTIILFRFRSVNATVKALEAELAQSKNTK